MPWLSCIISNVVLASRLALTAWFVQRRLRRPALARLLGVLVLIKLVTPPLISVPLGGPSDAMACALGLCRCGQHVLTQSAARDALLWLLPGAWLVGAAATGWTAWRRWGRFRQLRAHGTAAPPEWQALAVRLAGKLAIRRPPEILAVPGRLPPLVVAGWRRPRMLVPMELLDRLTAAQREALLLHELVHIQRGDHLVRLVELAVRVVYWWLPFVGLIARQLRDCEEACCDAAVLARLPHARRDYACLLLDVLDFVTPLPERSVWQATAMSAAQDLEHRVRSILDATPGKPLTRLPAAIVAGLACALLPCEFHYGFGRPSSPAAVLPERETTPQATPLLDSDRSIDRMAACCPS